MRSATGRVAFMGNHKPVIRPLPRTAHNFGLRREKVPGSGAAPRNPWKKKMTGLRSRCVNAVESREHARLRNSQNVSCLLSFHGVGRVVTLVAIAKTSRSCYCGNEIPFERFDRSRNDPLNFVAGGLPRFSIRVKGESVVKGMSERIKWSE